MSSKTKCSAQMLTASPAKAIISFALPMILGNLFQQFYNIMDSVIVGRYVGEEALASVGASYAITNVFIAVAIGGGVGSAVIISQFLGAGDDKKMKTAVFTTLINFLVIALVLGTVGVFLNDQILRVMRTPGNVFQDAATYLRIYFIGLPFLFMYNVQASVFNALGDSKTPLFLLIFSSVLNIALDLFFVLSFGWGVAGVAVATLVAQSVSAFISFMILTSRLKSYETTGKVKLYDNSMVLSMMKVAVPSILQQSIVHFGILLVQLVVNTFGSAVMAGYAAATRIESISTVPMLAMGNAMSTYTAQNIGAQNIERVRQGYRVCYGLLFLFALILCVTLNVFGPHFLSAFMPGGTSEIAFETGISYLRFISFFFILIGMKAITDGLLRGAGDVLVFTLANFANLAVRVFVAFYYSSTWGVSAVWVAVPVGWALNYVISFSWYLTGRWKRVRLIKET